MLHGSSAEESPLVLFFFNSPSFLSLSPSLPHTTALLARRCFFNLCSIMTQGGETEDGQNQKLSPLPRGGLAAAQGEEVGSNERSWPGAARPGSAHWLHTQPPNYREQSRAASRPSPPSLHPKPPSSLLSSYELETLEEQSSFSFFLSQPDGVA